MRPTLTALLGGLALALSAAAESLETTGRVDAVTVYRGQALVTRLVDIPGPAGLREVTVTGLPEHVVPASIHAESNAGLEVRSVRYLVRAVEADVREEVRRLDEQLQALEEQLAANDRFQQVLGQQTAYLDRLEAFSGTAAVTELSHGVLNAATLRELTEHIFTARRKVADDELTLAADRRRLEGERNLAQRRRGELTTGSSRVARTAVVFVNVRDAAGGQLHLRYLVNNASWQPSYNLRATADRASVTVEYNASIQQTSGEDWTDVATTLSTATPSLAAKAPSLAPLSLALVPRDAALAQREGSPITTYSELYSRRNAFQQQRASLDSTEFGEKGAAVGNEELTRRLDSSLNTVAGEMQLLDLVSAGRPGRAAALSAQLESISVTYHLPARTSLPSRADRQLVQIASDVLAAEFYRVAAPVLSNYVYEEARIVNGTPRVLLAGPVGSYLDGQFVGHGQIDTIAAGQSFTAGFGIDATLRVDRVLVDRTEVTQGGNRVVDFKYELSVENYADQPATVRLMDRLPQGRGSELKVTLTSDDDALSKDSEYRRTERKQGLLRWDVDAPGEAVGPKALKLTYQFRLEYDRQMTIVGLPGAAE
jgi:hypothetical protein